MFVIFIGIRQCIMPNRDFTGPEGKGPMTGRGMGNCIVPIKEGFFRRIGRGLGLGRGRGMGRGLGRGYGRRLTNQANLAQKKTFTIQDLNK